MKTSWELLLTAEVISGKMGKIFTLPLTSAFGAVHSGFLIRDLHFADH